MGIRIDHLNAAVSADDAHEIVAMKDDATVKLNVAQIKANVVGAVVGGAPADMDTLAKVSASIGDDADFAGTMSTALAAKADASSLAAKADAADTDINSLTNKGTPVDADEFRIADSAASFGFKKLSWASVKAAIKAFFNASGSAPVYACRAWVNFNGTGTVAIRASGNVSSITDRGVGLYTVNFTTALPDANYAGVASATIGGAVNSNRGAAVGPIDSSTAYVNAWSDDTGSVADVEQIHVAIFR